jgi:hypothetical protein
MDYVALLVYDLLSAMDNLSGKANLADKRLSKEQVKKLLTRLRRL